jgi:BlaI family penicillinase repressor
MEPYKLGEMEQKFADLIWESAPVSTRELTDKCAQVFDWKRTTTYTMLKRLCGRGLFQMKDGRVTALVKKEEFQAAQGEQFLNENFGGSLPRFLAAFTRRNRLTEMEIAEIEQLIEAHREEEGE